jgi:hypothetical protein
VARLRDRLAREYIRGQAEVLAGVEGDVEGRLAALAARACAPAAAPLPAAEGSAPLLGALPGVACALRAPRGSGPFAAATLPWLRAGAPAGQQPLLHVPARYLLCASNAAAQPPGFSEALDRVEGLQLPPRDDARGFWDAAHARLMLLLLAERRRRGEGGGGGGGKAPAPGQKRGRGREEGAPLPDWHAPWLALRDAFVDWARSAFGEGGEGAPATPLTAGAWPWGAPPPSVARAPWGGARFEHGDLFPALSRAFPRLFPQQWFTETAWRWAEAVVEAAAVPARPAGAPLQLALPLLFPLPPTPALPPRAPLSASLGEALACADPSLGLPPCAQWATAGGESGALELWGGAAAVCVNPAAPAEAQRGGGGGVFCEALPLPVPVEACGLLEWGAAAEAEGGGGGEEEGCAR